MAQVGSSRCGFLSKPREVPAATSPSTASGSFAKRRWTDDEGDGADSVLESARKGLDAGMPTPDPGNTRIFAMLRRYNRLDLLVPVNSRQMWHAVMDSKPFRLTVLGEHRCRLVEKGRI